MAVSSNAYAEELNFAIEWVPTSEDDGYVAFTEAYTYDPGVRFGEENRGPIPVSVGAGAHGGLLRTKSQGGYGMLIRQRGLCLANALSYNWRQGIRWNLAWNFVSCLPFGVRWHTGGYIGCLAWGTGIDQVTGFVGHVIDELSGCGII